MSRLEEINFQKIYSTASYEELVEAYSSLVNKNIKWVRIKNITIGIFIFLVLVSAFVDVHNLSLGDKNLLFNEFWFPCFLFSYLFTHIISIFMHKKAALKTLLDAKIFSEERRGELDIFTKKSFEGVSFHLFNLVKKILLFFITPDYFWAGFYKKKIGSIITSEELIAPDKLEFIRMVKKFYIERCNWSNLNITIIIALLCFICFSKESTLYGWLSFLAFTLVLCRTISRILEIIIAFYYDIVNEREIIFYFLKEENQYKTIHFDVLIERGNYQEVKKAIANKPFAYFNSWSNTMLLPKSRVSLALHSLLEVIIIFSVLYYLLSGLSHYFPSYFFTPLIEKENIGVMKYILYSFSISVTLPDIKLNSYWSLLVSLQLLGSLILIIMSLAHYLGRNYEMQEHEKEMYAQVKIKKYSTIGKDEEVEYTKDDIKQLRSNYACLLKENKDLKKELAIFKKKTSNE